mgnify:CR=1 FL=1|tara:strand:+ start:65 stop:424 length:360 start_codon:yes stop_codon:yes gene_type:complete
MTKKTLFKKIAEQESYYPGLTVESLDSSVKLWKKHFPEPKKFQDLESFLESFYDESPILPPNHNPTINGEITGKEEHVFREFKSALNRSILNRGIKLLDKDFQMFKESYPEILSTLGIK